MLVEILSVGKRLEDPIGILPLQCGLMEGFAAGEFIQVR